MSEKVLDVMGSRAAYSLLMDTLDNIRDIAPSTAFDRGDAIDRSNTGASPAQGGAQPFTSGVGSLTDKKA